MKKRSLYHRSLSLLGLLLLSLTIFVVSCKKQFTNESQINLNSLKNWQTKNFDHSSLLFNTLYPNWNKLFVNDQGSQNVYEVEVTNKEKIFLSLGFVGANSADSIASKSKIKMLLFEDKESGKITDGYYMVSVSEDNPHYKQYNSFTGAVYYYTTSGYFLNGYIYDHGKIIKGIKGAGQEAYRASINERLELKTRGLPYEKLQLAAIQECYTDISPVYGVSCVGVEGYQECSLYVKGYNYTTVCTDIPGTGGGGGVGGSGGSDGSGGSGGGTAPTAPEETEEQKEAKRQTDCATFIFKKTTSANWQEAGVNNVKLKWVWVDLQTGTSRTMEVPMDHVVIGFPTHYTNSYNGSTSQHTAGRAANRAAMAVEQARRATYIKFAHEGLPMEVTVRSFFMQTLNALVAANQGTAGYNGTGSNNIVFNDEERSYISDPLDCDPDGGIE